MSNEMLNMLACLSCPLSVYLFRYIKNAVYICASVAQLQEAKSKVEGEKVAIEEDRKMQLLLNRAEVRHLFDTLLFKFLLTDLFT